jgi:hypothetical protein
MTNADRIRGMSDEELAAIIYRHMGAENACRNLKKCRQAVDSDGGIPDDWCVQCVLTWLRQPVEV